MNWGLLVDLWRGLRLWGVEVWKWWAREVDRLLGIVCEGCRIGGFAYPHTCGGKRMYAVWKREDGKTVVYGKVVEGRGEGRGEGK